MSFFYGDVKSSELQTANGVKLLKTVSGSDSITLDTDPTLATAYTLKFPATLGSTDQVLKLSDATGTLTFGTVSSTSALDDITAGDAASNLTTSSGTLTVYSQTSDVILKSGSNVNSVTADNLITSNTFSLGQGTSNVAATGTEVLDFADRSDFLISLSGTSTLTLASKNVNRVGQQGSIIITQTADTNSLSWQTSNGWYFPAATAPTLSSGTGNYDVFSYIVVAAAGSKKILIMDATNFQAY